MREDAGASASSSAAEALGPLDAEASAPRLDPVQVSSPVGSASFFRSADVPPTPPSAAAAEVAAAAAAAAVDALGEFGGGIAAARLPGLGELLRMQFGRIEAEAPPQHQPRRATSVGFLGSPTNDTFSEPDTFTEHTLGSADTSVSSTRAGTSAFTGDSGSRQGRGSRRGFSVGFRAGRSPNAHGYRGRSVTRREGRGGPGAALRHRHPTHTPSRGPTARGGLGGLGTALGTTGLAVPSNLGGYRDHSMRLGALALGPLSLASAAHGVGRGTAAAAFALGHHSVGRDQEASTSRLVGPHRMVFHQIGRVREDPAESGC